jgi:16S rRNA G966 N2-methylase RsmD
MAKKSAVAANVSSRQTSSEKPAALSRAQPRPFSLLDTRVIYCGDCLDQLRRLPDDCVDLSYIDPPFNSNRNYEVFWGETKEKEILDEQIAEKLV